MATPLEASMAANALFDLNSSDREALLEVIQDYFTSPIAPDEHDPDDEISEDSDDDAGYDYTSQDIVVGTVNNSTCICTVNNNKRAIYKNHT